MNRVGDKEFYEGLSFLRDLLSSLDEDERLNFPADLETIFLCSHDSDAKPMRLEAVVRFYNYFCELKEKLHHGEKLCERFLSAIDEGELEAFDVGDLVTRDNVERDDEDCRFNGVMCHSKLHRSESRYASYASNAIAPKEATWATLLGKTTWTK